MTRPAAKHPTELELEILKVLWNDGASPVRHVKDALAGRRDLAYTSVMTMMGIMTDKGYLKRVKKGNGYVYSPAVNKEHTVKRMLGDVVKRVFDGSTTAAVLHLLDTGEIDKAEMKQLRRLIDKKMGDES